MISILFWISITPAFSATWDGGGVNESASNSANWDITPHHGDDIFFDGTSSKDCTWDLVNSGHVDKIFSSLTIEGAYAGTVTLDWSNTLYPDSSLTLLNAVNLTDTGQTECYDPAGSPMDNCAGTGQDGDYSIHPMSLTDNGNSTITDNVTGLLWQKCSYGLSGVNCALGAAITSDWAAASAACASLDLDGTGWRLPADFELVNIADYGRYGPAINVNAFPNTSAYYYWTANTYSNDDLQANFVYFYSGIIGSADKSDTTIYTRCVRGTVAANARVFSDNGDGTITDDATGLVWQKCSIGQTNDEGCTGFPPRRTWDQALSDCNGSTLLGYTWRLPNIKELNSISDTSLYPSINDTYFPNTPPSMYWSSTTYADTAYALSVGFGFGGAMIYLDKDAELPNQYFVRCVMGQ